MVNHRLFGSVGVFAVVLGAVAADNSALAQNEIQITYRASGHNTITEYQTIGNPPSSIFVDKPNSWTSVNEWFAQVRSVSSRTTDDVNIIYVDDDDHTESSRCGCRTITSTTTRSPPTH